jgi:hypothetical protein
MFRVSRESSVLVLKVGVSRGGLLLLTREMSDLLDLLELVVAHVGCLLKLAVDLVHQLLSRGLAHGGLLLGDGLHAGEMLAELILALLGRLLTLLICHDLLVFALLQLLTVLVIDGPLSLQREAAALLGYAGRDWPDAVPKHVVALFLCALQLLLDVVLAERNRGRVGLQSLLDIRCFSSAGGGGLDSWRGVDVQDFECDGVGGVLLLLEDLWKGSASAHLLLCKFACVTLNYNLTFSFNFYTP